ncbi:MAG: lactate dehydrogenase [Methanospirillum sp.]|nr:lactate dehydrogenase [Methanospirillum sp.]
MTSLAVFGTGKIGGGVAAMAASSGLISNLVLYDRNQNLLEAQRLDLSHMGCRVSLSTNISDIPACDIIIFTAGLPRNPDIKTRAALLQNNLPAARELASLLVQYPGILVVVSNPADILTWYLWKKTGISRSRILGFGGQLDSARFQYEATLHGLAGTGSVLGEHGEHQVPVFSRMKTTTSVSEREDILHRLRNASMEIIRGKGATEYAPVYHIWNLIQKILTNSPSHTICSTILEGEYGFYDCSLGMPVQLGRNGIQAVEKWNLDPWEERHLKEAADFVSDLCRSIPDAR